MSKDLHSREDVKASKIATKDGGNLIKIGEGKTPIYIMSSKYEDGYAHYVKLPNGDIVRVACGGGVEGKGYLPDACPICKINKSGYNEARELKEAGRIEKSKILKEHLRRQRGGYELYFIAAEGELTVDKIVKGKKRLKVDFSDARIGKLKLSAKQKDDLWAVFQGGAFSYISSVKDILNRYIIFDKRKRGEDDFATIEYHPAKVPTTKPKIKITAEDKEGLDLSVEFAIDMKELKKVASALLEGEDADEEVDYDDEDVDDGDYEDEDVDDDDELEDDDAELEDDDDDLEDDDDDDFLNDDDDDEDEDIVEETDDEGELTEDFLDDIDFEDDLPWDADEEEPAIPKKGKKKSSTKSTKKASGTKKRSISAVAETEPDSTNRKKKTGTAKKSRKSPPEAVGTATKKSNTSRKSTQTKKRKKADL